MAELKDITRFDTEKFLRIFSIDVNFREIVVSSFLQKVWDLEGLPPKVLISSLYSEEFENLQLTESMQETIKEKRQRFFNLIQILLLNRQSLSEFNIDDFIQTVERQIIEEGEVITIQDFIDIPLKNLNEDFVSVRQFRDAISSILGVNFLPKKVFRQILYTFKYSTLKNFFSENWKKFLPEFDVLNMENSEQILVFQESLMKEFDRLSSTIDEIYDIADVDRIPNKYLNYLAQTIGYEREDEDFLFDASFRELIKNIIEVYRIKGTNFSFELFFNFLGFEVELREFWFDQRFSDPNVVVNPFTFISDRNNFGFYLTPIKPTDYIPSGLLNPFAVSDAEIIDTQDGSFFNRFVGEIYTSEQVLGQEGVFPDLFAERFGVQKTYTYFKTNIIEIALSRIGATEVAADIGEEAPEEGDELVAGLTFEEIQIIQLYANFLTPIYLSRNIVVSIEPFRQEATSLIPKDDDRVGNDFPDFPEVPNALKRQRQFNTYVGLQPSFFYWDGGRQSLSQTRQQYLSYQQNLDKNIVRRFYADPTTSKIEGDDIEDRFDLRGEKINYIRPWDSSIIYQEGNIVLIDGKMVICIEDYTSDDMNKPLSETIYKWQRWPLTGIEPGGLFINGFVNDTYNDIFNVDNPKSVYSQVKEDLNISSDDPYRDEKILKEISKFSQTRKVRFTGDFTENLNEIIINEGNILDIKKGFKLEQVRKTINVTVDVQQGNNILTVTSGNVSEIKEGDKILLARKNFDDLKSRFNDFEDVNLSNLDFFDIANENDPDDLTITNSRVVLVSSNVIEINGNEIEISPAPLQSAANLTVQIYRIVAQSSIVDEIDEVQINGETKNVIKVKNTVGFDTSFQEQIKENENSLHTEENLEFFVVGNILNAYKINGKDINPRDFLFPIIDRKKDFTNPLKTNNFKSFFGRGTPITFHTNKLKTGTGRINVNLTQGSKIASFVSGNLTRLFETNKKQPVLVSRINGILPACEVEEVNLQDFTVTLSEEASSTISNVTLLYNFEESNIKNYWSNLNKYSSYEDPNTPNSFFNRAIIKQVISENSEGNSEIVISDPLARFTEFKEYDNFKKIEVFANFEENSYEVNILPSSFFDTRDLELSGEFFNDNQIILNSSNQETLENLKYELRTKEIIVFQVRQSGSVALVDSKVLNINPAAGIITVNNDSMLLEPATLNFTIRVVSKNISLIKPGFEILPQSGLIERAEVIKVDLFNSKVILNKKALSNKTKEKITLVRKEFEDRFVGTFKYGKKRVTNVDLSDDFVSEEYVTTSDGGKVYFPGNIVFQKPPGREIRERFICIREHNTAQEGLSIIGNRNFERFNPFDYIQKGMKIKNPSDLFEYEITRINSNESYTFKGIFDQESRIIEILEENEETKVTAKDLAKLSKEVKYRFSATFLEFSFLRPNRIIKSFAIKPEYRLFYERTNTPDPEENTEEAEGDFYNFYLVYSGWKGLAKGSEEGPLEAEDFTNFKIVSGEQTFRVSNPTDYGFEELGEQKGNIIKLWTKISSEIPEGKPQLFAETLEADEINQELYWLGPQENGRKFLDKAGVITFETQETAENNQQIEVIEEPIYFQLDSLTASFDLNRTFGNFEQNELLEDFNVLAGRQEKRLRFTLYRENFNFIQIKGTRASGPSPEDEGVSFDGIYNVKSLVTENGQKKLILNSKIDYDQNTPGGFVWIYKRKRNLKERMPFFYNEIEAKKEQFGFSGTSLESKSTSLFLEDQKYFSTKVSVLENSLGSDLNGQYFTIDTRKNNINYFYFTTTAGKNDPNPQFIQSIFEKTQSIDFDKKVGGLGFPVFLKINPSETIEYRFFENYDEETNSFLYFLVLANWQGSQNSNQQINVTTSDVNGTFLYIEEKTFIFENSVDFGSDVLSQPSGNIFLLWSNNHASKPSFNTENTIGHEILLNQNDNEKIISKKLHDYILNNLQNIFIPSYREYSSTVLVRNIDYGVVRPTRTEGINLTVENFITKRNFNVADNLIQTFGRFSVGINRIPLISNNFNEIVKEYRNSHKLVIGPLFDGDNLILERSEVIDLIEKGKTISENGVLLSERSNESIIIVSNPAFVNFFDPNNITVTPVLEKPEMDLLSS